MHDGEGIGEKGANAEAGCVVSEKRANPGTNGKGKSPVVEYRDQAGGVEVVVEAGDVEEQEGSSIVGGACGLDAVNQDRNHIDGGVMGPQPKLHGG